MPHLNAKPEDRRGVSGYQLARRNHFRNLAHKILGSKCRGCGLDGSEGHDLRIRFISPLDPLKRKYLTNPVTLHRRLYLEPALRNRVALLCQLCRLAGGLNLAKP
jgi:hypothetical protein